MTPIYNPREFFFDRIKVIRAMDKARLRAFSKIGSFIRTRARSLLNRGGGKDFKVSGPGQPPRKHTGALRDGILFSYDPTAKTVVVGPTRFNQVSIVGGIVKTGIIPEILEKGGSVGVIEEQIPGWWFAALRVSTASLHTEAGAAVWRRVNPRAKRNNLPRRIRYVKIAPRPYMFPALEHERRNGKLMEAWQNVLTG